MCLNGGVTAQKLLYAITCNIVWANVFRIEPVIGWYVATNVSEGDRINGSSIVFSDKSMEFSIFSYFAFVLSIVWSARRIIFQHSYIFDISYILAVRQTSLKSWIVTEKKIAKSTNPTGDVSDMFKS
jgi:hypothetical protein